MKPILFNTDMVRAILAGRKTVTRRVVKPPVPKPCELRKMQEGYHAGEWHLYCEDPLLDNPNKSPWGAQFLPPFQPGDTLYVRETWTRLYWVDMEGYTHYDKLMYYYAADGAPDIILLDADGFAEEDQRIRWRPSIHMPKEAARIFLRVKEVRVERLQEITVDDINNEGVDIEPPPICKKEPTDAELAAFAKLTEKGKEEYISTLARHTYIGWCKYADDLFSKWRSLWDSTIKKSDLDRFGWDANPWVWAISFERCEKPEGWPQ